MYSTILLAYDGSIEGRLALREGAQLAQTFGARVVLLAVVEPVFDPYLAGEVGAYSQRETAGDLKKILDEGRERLSRMGLSAEVRLEMGPAAERITFVAQEILADLVVVGHHKQGMMARWLRGSVTTSLSDSLNCSLLVARLEITDDDLFKAAETNSSNQ